VIIELAVSQPQIEQAEKPSARRRAPVTDARRTTMKHLIRAAIIGIALATNGVVSAEANSFAESYFKKIQLEGSVLPDMVYEDKRLNGI